MKTSPFFIILVMISVFSNPSLSAQGFKILQINSYSSSWAWIEDQNAGFVQGFRDASAQYRSIDLDAKNKDAAGVHAMVKQTKKLIEDWKPDLLFVTDDLAQMEISAQYLGGSIPIVFSGVNAAPADYAFDKAANVTGVLEREHFTATINFLRTLLPKKNLRLAIVIDDDATWIGVVARIKEALKYDTSVEVVSWLQPRTYTEFKRAMLALQDTVDAVGMLGVFRFTGEDGKFVDYETVLRWTAENSRLPDFSFWETRIERGTLCAVAVSGVEQGRIAGAMARRILIDKISPALISPEQSMKGIPMLSLARARKLGIAVNSGVLLNSHVFPRFIWD